MLYCPKCQASYPDGTQRFCTNEGARLLPLAAPESSVTSADKGVFTSILGKTSPKTDETEPISDKSAAKDPSSFEPPVKSKFFKTGETDEAQVPEVGSSEVNEEILEIEQKKTFEALPIAKIINPSTIPEVNSARRSSTKKAGKKAGEKIGVAGLMRRNQFEPEFDDLLEIGMDTSSELSGTGVTSGNFEINPYDPLDTGELFQSENDFAADDRGQQDILALPGLDIDIDNSKSLMEAVDDTEELELDLESDDEVNLATSIPRIELELAGIDEVPEPSADGFKFEPVETNDGVSERAEEFVAYETDVTTHRSAASTSVIVDAIDLKPDIIKATDNTAWEHRSSESSDPEESRWFLYPLVGIAILGFGLLSFFYLTSKDDLPVANTTNSESSIGSQPNLNSNNSVPGLLTDEELIPAAGNPVDIQSQPDSALLDIPPQPRTVKQPPNTRLYKNEKKEQKGVLAEKFLGFSIYYPKDWSQANADNKFLDIARKAPGGLPIKQLLISRYDSRGTFEGDRDLFEELVKNSNADLRRILANYQVISEGEGKFQDGRWRTYEVKFQGIGSDKKLIIWGRRLWIPVQRAGMTSGFIITMIGTSLSNDVKSVEDLGVNDDLAEILKTFEPDLK